MIPWEALFYFAVFLVPAVLLAILSGNDNVQKLVAVIFAGWAFYTPVKELIPIGVHIWTNLALDVVLAAYAFAIWKKCRGPACAIVLGCFGAMICVHLVQLGMGLPRLWYYGALNALFASQLIAIGGFSGREYRRKRKLWLQHKANRERYQRDNVVRLGDVAWPTPIYPSEMRNASKPRSIG